MESMGGIRSQYPEVNDLFHRLDAFQCKANERKKIVECFLAKCKSEFDNKDLWITFSEFKGVGSSYEGTAVTENTDFDISLMLAPPLCMDNFEIVEVKDVGLFKLEYKNTDKGALGDFINDNDFLFIKKIRDQIFRELEYIVNRVKMDDYEIKTKDLSKLTSSECVCSFKVELVSEDCKLDLDIVPMIKVDCQIPGFDKSILPENLQRYVKDSDFYAMFSLSPPPKLGENYSHLVVQTAFDLLEEETLKQRIDYTPTLYRPLPKIKNTSNKNPNPSKTRKRNKVKTTNSKVSKLLKEVEERANNEISPKPKVLISKRNRSVSRPAASSQLVRVEKDHLPSNIGPKSDARSSRSRSRVNVQDDKNSVTFCLHNPDNNSGQAIIRDSICIAKFVSKYFKWSAEGLKSFHIKRVALSIFDEISKAKDPWMGYKFIVRNLVEMLFNSAVCGVFLRGQNVITLDESACDKLAEKIEKDAKTFKLKKLKQILEF